MLKLKLKLYMCKYRLTNFYSTVVFLITSTLNLATHNLRMTVSSVLLISALAINSGCTIGYLYDSQTRSYLKDIYVDYIPDLYGVVFRNQLQQFFSNTNLSTSKYILRIQTNIDSSDLLTNNSGFITQKRVTFVALYSIINKNNNKILFTSSVRYNGYYNIEPSVYATQNNQNTVYALASKTIAADIAIKTAALIKETQGDLTKLSQKPQTKSPTITDYPKYPFKTSTDDTYSSTPSDSNTNSK